MKEIVGAHVGHMDKNAVEFSQTDISHRHLLQKMLWA